VTATVDCHLSNCHHRDGHICQGDEVYLSLGGPRLDEGVHGVDGRRGLRTLVPFVCVFLFLAAVLADEGSVLVELSVPALPVVHQAVVALVAAHRPVGRRPAALQRLVVLRVAAKEMEGRLLRRSFVEDC